MNNFENVKVGDTVIIHTRYREDIGTVTKVNKVTFEVTCGKVSTLYNKNDGWERGRNSWNPNWVVPATEESMKKVMETNRKNELAWRIGKTDWNSLSLDLLEKIYELVKK